jgi:hypothetical protein
MDALIHEMSTLQIQFKGWGDKPAEDPSEYVLMREQIKEATLKADTVIDDSKQLVADATDCGLSDAAKNINDAVRSLRKQISDTGTVMGDRKTAIGIIETGGHESRADLEPPKFSGTMDPDYYTFLSEWTLYTSAKRLGKDETYILLSRTCLSGAALHIARRCNTVKEIFDKLEKAFGNARAIFQAKVDDMKKLGRCTGDYQARRTWIVDVRARMEIIERLADEHKLHQALHLTNLIGYVQSQLQPYMVTKFQKIIREKDDSGNIAPSEAWPLLKEFLDTLAKDLTFDINHALNFGVAPVISATSKKQEVPSSSDTRKSSSGKKAYTASSQGGAAAVAQPTAALPATGGSAVKKRDKSDKKNKKGNKNSTVIISAAYTAPVNSMCVHCNVPHTMAFYCPVFQKARDKERVSIAAKMRVCFACLRMDALQVKENRDQWYEGHKVNCKSEWLCDQGKCIDMTGRYRWHMLLCCYHQEHNKTRLPDFIKTLDKAVMPSPVDFFFCQPASIYQVAAPAMAPPNNDTDIFNDVVPATIFMLQHIEVKGQELLTFYDSGCGGSAITTDAAKLLETNCIREGPTLLNVAGGKTLRIEGGDESFILQLHASHMKATFTGLRMDSITTKFPIWYISDAWSEVTAEILSSGYDTSGMPAAPAKIGGKPVDLMLGIRYLKYYPELLFILPSGLGVYKSQIAAPRDEVLVLGGPHPCWRKCAEDCNLIGPYSFFSSEYRAYSFACSTIRHVLPCIEHVPDNRVIEIPVGQEETGQVLSVDQELAQPGHANPAQLTGACTDQDTRTGGPEHFDLTDTDNPSTIEYTATSVDQELVQPGHANPAQLTGVCTDQDTLMGGPEHLGTSPPMYIDITSLPWTPWIDRNLQDTKQQVREVEEDDYLQSDQEDLLKISQEAINYIQESDDFDLPCTSLHCDIHSSDGGYIIPPSWKTDCTIHSLKDVTNKYLESELSGGMIDYRCVLCRNCAQCRSGETLEAVSIKKATGTVFDRAECWV